VRVRGGGWYVWGEDDLEKISPKENYQVKEGSSKTRVVGETTSPPRTPPSTPSREREKKQEKGKRSSH